MQLSGGPLALLGEVRTGLLPESAALSRGSAAELLTLVRGRRVQSRERPVSWAQSPVIAEGVDCRLATPSRGRVRGVGTVAAHAVVLGGRILQSSAVATVTAGEGTHRRGWGHYLSRIGLVEILTRIPADIGAQLVDGFLGPGDPTVATLDPGAIAARLHMRVRTDPMLNQKPPIQTGASRLRWAARVERGAAPSMSFVLVDDETRLASVVVGDDAELGAVQRFCEDLAMHDWLLTVLTEVIDEAEMAELSRSSPAQVLTPLLEHLVHLWLPGAFTPPPLRGLWTGLESDPGFTVQWNSRIGQLRDRVAVATLGALTRSQTRW
ncbi:SCO2521 family protein [Nocardia neocaledoniensis]|uniref:SCO2521 family protein n=1 Tax=Nocardia neocaledoniensis TaxID=236511 RepID=UPI00245867E4|nr:SCO2521 family protein [Nocardia neocaledoniensis]